MQKPHAHSAPLTHRLVRLASHPADHRSLPADVVLRAKHSLADWFACALAGSAQQDARRLRAYADSWTAEGPCTVLGANRSASAPAAALMNGFSGHVLDYDDVNLRSQVHASAAVLPAVWALAEAGKASGAKLLDAYIAGYDAMCLLGLLGGARHYNTGWHASSVLGVFGSGVACAAILGADARAAGAMFGLALAQASGVQSVFGTAGKPFQMARAAEAGLHAAMLARAGFAGHTDVLDRPRGLAELFSFEAGTLGSGIQSAFPLRNALLKFHASCTGTHAPLEAVRKLQVQGLSAENLVSLELRLAPHAASVCSIESPSSANEIKFSVSHLCAMRLAGIETGDAATYTDAAAKDGALRAIARKIKVARVEGLQTAETEVRAELADGRSLSCHVDMGIPEPDLDKQGARLERKFLALASPVVGDQAARVLLTSLLHVEDAGRVDEILAPIRKTGDVSRFLEERP